MTAYRTAGTADAYRDPPPLRPFELGVLRHYPNTRRLVVCRKCKCAANISRLCTGGRFGFLWLSKCIETREHFHVKCITCSGVELMHTANGGAS